jgi:spermidine synthase
MAAVEQLSAPSSWVNKKYLLSSFVFPNGFFDNNKDIEINSLGSGVMYDYYRQAWQTETELYKN